MNFKVIGYRHSFGTKRSGEQYDDYIVFCTRPGVPEENEVGDSVEIVRVPASYFGVNAVTVGDEISPVYDRMGRFVSY